MGEQGYTASLLPAEGLMQSLQALINMAKIYQANNQLVVNSIRQLVSSSQALLAGQDWVTIHLENGRFFVNDEKLLRRKGLENILDNFYLFLSDRRIPGFRILPGITTAPGDEMIAFAKHLNRCAEQPEPAEWLEEQLLAQGIGWISVLQTDDSIQNKERPPEQAQEPPGRHYPRKIYAYTVRALRDAAEKVSAGQRFGMRKAARMVQTMVEEVSSGESQLLPMSTVRDHADNVFLHSVNVAVLSLLLGRELGLEKDTLERLGTCALFHDLGKLTLPEGLLARGGGLGEADWAAIRQHSMESVRLVAKLMVAPAGRKTKIMMPLFEHHLKVDLSGYPDLGWRKPVSLIGRILAVADAYDALTSSRAFRRQPYSGDRALGLMQAGIGSSFDGAVLKAFVRMMGIYPIGTLLTLAGGDVAMVSRPPAGTDLRRPWITILQDDGQGGLKPDREINLEEPPTGDPERYRVVASAHPATRNLQPARLLT